jgi:PAS domain S-box-containing protein
MSLFFLLFEQSRDTAMVVFDLVKSPAIILTANEQFCRLFGYKMEDVVGMPWKQLIHPDYLERTTGTSSTLILSFPSFILVFVLFFSLPLFIYRLL